jgi:peptide/nickel transport system substrate-binding protein
MKRRNFLAAAAASLAAPAIAQPARLLRFVPESDIAVLDPVWTTASQSRDHGFMIYDTLFGMDDSYTPQPQMLEGSTVENDGKLWRLTLRKGLIFHDGAPVLARDCAASIRRWGKRDTVGQALMAAVAVISAPDDRTILVRLQRPFPLLPAALGKNSAAMCAIMPERLASIDAFTQVTDTTGSGPFRFKADERVPGSRLVYERFAGYVPRQDGKVEGTAGPKIVNFDRVEWLVIQDPTTQAAALQRNEIDWVLYPNADMVPKLRTTPGISVHVIVPAGSISMMRFNQLQPPFNNPAIRRALLPAIVQSDYMLAMMGDNRDAWRDGVGFFCPDTPMASDAGMAALTGPRSLDTAKQALAAAGYKGERVVLLGPGDIPYAKTLADITADLYRKVGLNLDYQVMDWVTLVQRRAKTEPVEQGGWSTFHTNGFGIDMVNPVSHGWLRGNGSAGLPGWPESQTIEALRDEWLAAPDLTAQKAVAAKLQLQAFQDLPYIPLGQQINPTAHRADLSGILLGLPLFWNVRRGQ